MLASDRDIRAQGIHVSRVLKEYNEDAY